MPKFISGWLLAPSVSTYGPSIDHLYNVVLLITGIFFVLTELTLIAFTLRYRARPGQKALYSHGSTKAEIIWTTVPAVILVILGIMSQNLWAKLRQNGYFPESDMTVHVLAEQWLWHFKYDGPDGEIDVQNEFHIPVGKNVLFILNSQDVIHGFYIPDLRINQDTVPGVTSTVWVNATHIGQHELRCTQFCGTNHYQMKGLISVDSPEDFQAWLKGAKATAF